MGNRHPYRKDFSMFQSEYNIQSMTQLNPTTYSLVLDCAELAAESWCGRFVNIRCGEKPLRRPISISEIDKENGTITLVFEVRGEGTEWLSMRKAGDKLDVLGPLGNGFFPDSAKRAIFIGGGIGCPPMLGAAQEYGENAEAILGFRSAAQIILLDKFKACCQSVDVTTNDGSFGVRGFVTDVLADKLSENKDCVVYACGPTPMLKGVAEMCAQNDVQCFVSLEQRMGCGIGACLVCACKTHEADGEHMRHVCKNGPVFDAKEVDFGG